MKNIKIIIYTLFLMLIVFLLTSCKKTYTIKLNYDINNGIVTIIDEANDNKYFRNEKIIIKIEEKNGFKLNSIIINNEKYDTLYEININITSNLNIQIEFIEDTINLSVDYDELLGNVIVTPNSFKYNKGDEIIIEVIPNENVSIKSFELNDINVTLTDNKYKFTIIENTSIKVEFEEYKEKKLSEEALNSLKNNIKFDGAYIYDETGEEYDSAHSITTIFGTDSIHQIETDLMTGNIIFNEVYINSNGIIAEVERLIDNTILITESYMEEKFSDFYNQFNYTTVEDFVEVKDNVYAIKDLEIARKVATSISGWNESIEYFYVYFENDKAVKLEFKSKEIDTVYDTTYVSSYEFDILEHQIAEIDTQLLNPYEKTEDHKVLEEALKQADDATNYTINHFDHEEGFEDVEYNVFVTDKAIYGDYVDFENGYVEIDGLIYPFIYDTELNKAILQDPIASDKNISEFQALFSKITVELFEYKGDGLFVLRDLQFVSEFTQYFAEGIDEMKQYYYATNLSIKIKDGQLYQVLFTYNILNQITADVILTYSNFNNTTLPINFDNVEKESILDDFIGSYRDENGNFAVINQNNIVINGEQFIFASYDNEYNMLEGTINGEVFYINKLSENQLYISNEDFSISYILLSTEETKLIEIPKEFQGVWENQDYLLEIQTYAVILNNNELKVSSYSESGGLIALDNDKTYSFILENEKLSVLVVNNDMKYYSFVLNKSDKNGKIEIPLVYIGTYQTADLLTTITITAGSIMINNIEFKAYKYTDSDGFIGTYNGINDYTIMMSSYSNDTIIFGTNDENFTAKRITVISNLYLGTWISILDGTSYMVVITDTSISINDIYIYDFKYDIEYGYSGTYNNETIYLKHIVSAIDGSDVLILYSDTIQISLERLKEGEVLIQNKFIGVYEGNLDGVIYKIVITDKSITVSIDNVTKEIIIKDYIENSFIIEIEGIEYLIMDASYSDPVTKIVFSTSDYQVVVICNKCE